MKIACPKCGREYRLDPARIPAKGARFTCWGCQAKVEVRPVQTGDLRSQNTGEMTKPLPSEQMQAAAQSPAAVAAASIGLSSKSASTEQSSGKASAFEEDLDSDNFITGPGLQVVKGILSSGKSSSSDEQQQEQKKEPIKITCPKCRNEYRLDPGRIPIGGGKFTCRNCQARIEVRPVVKQEKTGSTASFPSIPKVTVSERSATAELSGEKPLSFASDALAAETSKTVDLPVMSELPMSVVRDMPALISLDAPAMAEEPPSPKAAPSTMSMQSPFDLDLKSEPAERADTTASTMSMGSPFAPINAEKEPPAEKEFGFEIPDIGKGKIEPLKVEEAASPWKLDEETEPSFDKPKPDPEIFKPKEAASTVEFSAVEVAALAAEMTDLKSQPKAEEKAETKPFDFSFEFDESKTPKLELPKLAEEQKEQVKTPSPPAPPIFDPFATVPITTDKKPEMASIVEQSMQEKKAEKEPDKKSSIFGDGASEDTLKTVTSMSAVPKPPTPPPFKLEKSPQKASQENAETLMSQFSTDSSFKDIFKKEDKPKEQPKPLPPPIKPSIPSPPQPPPVQTLRTQPPLSPPVQSLPKTESKPSPAPPPVFKSDPEPKPDPKIVSEEPAPIRFVYRADDQDSTHQEESVAEEPKRSIASRVAVGSIVGLAAVAVIAVVYFFFLKPVPPPDQQTQNIPASGNPAPSNTGTGTTEPSVSSGQATPPGQTAKPEPTKPTKPEPTKPTKPEPTKPTKPEPTKPTKPEPVKPVSTAPSGDGKYTIQVAAAPTEAEAKKFGDRFQAAGFQPYIVRADLGNKGVWYRVRMGRYGSAAEANKAAAQVKTKGFVCFIDLYQ